MACRRTRTPSQRVRWPPGDAVLRGVLVQTPAMARHTGGGPRICLCCTMQLSAPRSVPPVYPPPGLPPDPERCARDAQLALWLRLSAQGDDDAFERFYDATIGFARAMARRRLHDADVDDLLGDAFFEAWRCAARFDAERGSPLAWLLTIVRSRSLDLLRRRVVHPSVAGRDEHAADEIADTARDPSECLWQQQSHHRLHHALSGLSAPERWIVGLAYFRELSHSEIATRTGLPLGTVKSHLLRGQHKLRAALTS